MIQVLKFGGSSVSDATNISRVLDIVSDACRRGRVLLVCSAVSGCTDALEDIGACRDKSLREQQISALQRRHEAIITRLFTGAERRSCLREIADLFEDLRTKANIPAETFGELFSTTIIARKLACEGIQTLWIDAKELIRCEGGRVDAETTYKRMRSAVGAHPEVQVFVTPGFIASDENGLPTTLGRGGSDYSASLFAAALRADTLEIWTDVPGIMTTNPKDVQAARTIPRISFAAALDMASHGAKVLYAPALAPVMEAGIPFRIKSTFDPANPGTLVGALEEDRVEEWKGVSCCRTADSGEAQLCLVGENISVEPARRRIDLALSEAGISPSGEYSITPAGNILIPLRETVLSEALNAVHGEFFEDSTPSVTDVYIAGYGAVGRELVSLIGRSSERIASRTGKRIRIAGVSNSRLYMTDSGGIEPAELSARLEEEGLAQGDNGFVRAVLSSAPRKAVFVDCTDSQTLHLSYPEILRRGISIVTSNRRSVAVPYVQYASYKALARENGVFFRYDTSVGAALPILESIAGEANCSDSLVSIEAVVSCTLNYIITAYNGAKRESMATLLRQAQLSGLTEKDPRADIGGQDALRKLLILGREAGIPLQEEDVQVTPMLGEEFFTCDIEEFYIRLAEYEQSFVRREAELDAAHRRQRFVASIVRDPAARLGYRAEISMREVDADSPFWSVSGSENVTVIKSEYSAPLVIKGAGEGATLAASGIIKDILL